MFENVNHIIFIASRDCNLRCAYCFEDNKDSYHGDSMSFETLKILISRIRQDKERSLKKDYGTFEFSFHGGEPMLLGPEKTAQFIEYVQKNLPNIKINFSMQSNISLLSPAWYKLLKEYLKLGISFDGIFKRNNLDRTKSDILKKNIKILKKNKISFGFVMVLQRNNIKDFIHNAKYLSKRYGNIKANLVENVYTRENVYPEITSAEYFKFVFLPIYKHFLKTGQILEYNMSNIINGFCDSLIFEPPLKTGICNIKFCGGGTHMVQVEPDGKVSFCQRWSDKAPEKVIGNIISPTPDPWGITSLFRSLNLQLKKIKDIRELHCDTCIAQNICNYGCLAFALTKYQGEKTIRQELICDFYKKVALYLYENRSTLIFIWATIQNYKPIRSYDSNILLFEIPQNRKMQDSHFLEQIAGKVYLKIYKQQIDPIVRLHYMFYKHLSRKKRIKK